MKTPVLIRGGRIACNNAINKINKHFKKCKDGMYTFEIKPQTKVRSLPQNRMYWDILNQVEEQTGMESYEIHETMRATYLVDYSGPIAKVGSTTDLTTIEFTNYINKVVSHLSPFAVIRMPEDRG